MPLKYGNVNVLQELWKTHSPEIKQQDLLLGGGIHIILLLVYTFVSFLMQQQRKIYINSIKNVIATSSNFIFNDLF